MEKKILSRYKLVKYLFGRTGEFSQKTLWVLKFF